MACHGHSAQRARNRRAQGSPERRRREAPLLVVSHQPIGGTGPHQTKGGVHIQALDTRDRVRGGRARGQMV